MGEHIQGSDETCHVLLGTQLQHKDGGCSCGCGGISSYDTLRRVLPEPVAQAAVGAAAGSVLAVGSPAILVAARSPWDPWGTGNYSSRSLHTSIRIGFHISLFYCTHRS